MRPLPPTQRAVALLTYRRALVQGLAFQEQDQSVAACATSALWSVLQATAKLYQHPIPSPVAITKAATRVQALGDRGIPNRGLTLNQLAQAIQDIELEPTKYQVRSHEELRGMVYAYLMAKNPLLMMVHLVDQTAGGPIAVHMGRHAVAVTGFRMAPGPAKPAPKTGFLLRASRIDRIYAHDDQVGPFARMGFADEVRWEHATLAVKGKGASLSTSWVNKKRERPVAAIPDALVVPTYHKIRIRFDDVYKTVALFDKYVEIFRTKGGLSACERLEWDIYLCSLNDFKTALRENAGIEPAHKHKLLVKSMPRFLWRAIGRVQDAPVIELLFDATDIDQGPFFRDAVHHSAAYVTELGAAAKPALESARRLLRPSVAQILERFVI